MADSRGLLAAWLCFGSRTLGSMAHKVDGLATVAAMVAKLEWENVLGVDNCDFRVGAPEPTSKSGPLIRETTWML